VTGNGKPLILIADDDPDILSLVTLGLERSGYEVIGAGDGEQALAAAIARPPDLALLDVMMPKLDGYEWSLRGCAGTTPPVIFRSFFSPPGCRRTT
jgi:two-component system, OmpR family, response regulator VanR